MTKCEGCSRVGNDGQEGQKCKASGFCKGTFRSTEASRQRACEDLKEARDILASLDLKLKVAEKQERTQCHNITHLKIEIQKAEEDLRWIEKERRDALPELKKLREEWREANVTLMNLRYEAKPKQICVVCQGRGCI